MSRRSLHTSTSTMSEDENGEEMTELEYRIHARRGFEKLFKELQDRCVRAAKMNYHIAARHAKTEHRFGIVLAIFGPVASFILQKLAEQFNYNSNLTYITSIIVTSCIGIGLAMEPVQKAIDSLIPIFRDKKQAHVEAAAGWQFLELTIRAYKIQLKDPHLTFRKSNIWWKSILTERRKLCLTPIPENVYEDFSNKYPCSPNKSEIEQVPADQT
ncbi:unnamed protein product [Candidula unifasciata]|uniref:Uncharacterized protein n=1 Tax=Candidula unifasciata TaxID=100452 RepID=A0A8S3ZT58_9EUPU|nr:unnamed protein product [Candidula unifasciata]